MSKPQFIAHLASYAVQHGIPAGVLPSLIIAQGILESASGTSDLAVKANNLFGIKAGSDWTGKTYRKVTTEYVNGVSRKVTAVFRAYPNYEGAVKDLVHKYTHGTGWEPHNRYAAVLGERDYKAAIRAVHAAGYATDPQYPVKLNQIIEQNSLTKYDKELDRMVKVVLDAGHGINTPGKRSPNDEREWSFNQKVLKAAEARLKQYPGVQVLRTDDPTGRTDVPLASRTGKANAWGADLFVSFHHNALTGKWHNGGGTEVYWYNHPKANKKSGQVAAILAPLVAQAMGLPNRGVKRANFQVLRETKMPAVLVEGGFMDSTRDIKVMRDDARLHAQGVAIADGIAKYFGLKGAGAAPTPSKPVQTGKPTVPSSSTAGIDYGAYLYGQALKIGMAGVAVGRAQGDLTKLGYPLTVDNSYGPAMQAAIKKFQRDNGLEEDGIAGPATQAMMRTKLATLNKSKPSTPKGDVYRVIVDGKQVGAYRNGDNILEQAKKAVAAGKKDVQIQKV